VSRRVKLKRCGIYFCAALIPPWRRSCWRHAPALELAGLVAVAILGVVLLSVIN
jgi:hypothetical protein